MKKVLYFFLIIFFLVNTSCRKDTPSPTLRCSETPVFNDKVSFLEGEWKIKEQVVKRTYYYAQQLEYYDTVTIDDDYKIQFGGYGRAILTKGEDTLNDECFELGNVDVYEDGSGRARISTIDKDQNFLIDFNSNSYLSISFTHKNYNLPYNSETEIGYKSTIYFYYGEKVE